MAKNTLGYEPQDPSVFANEGDRKAATTPRFKGGDADKARRESQTTASTVAKRESAQDARATRHSTDGFQERAEVAAPAEGEEGAQS